MDVPRELRMKGFHFLIIALFLCSLPFFSWARKPAVDPIMGISIDNEPVDKNPSLSKGYKFDSYQELKRSPQSLNDEKVTLAINETDQTIPIFLIGFMLFLPALVWFGFLNHLKTPGELKVLKKNDENDHHHDDLKKAS